ncbi:DUF533 domain-containing protein [Citreimonas salinaria]|uniref:Uncharacterized protein n=1 Tax=Citreimonas salinaria TaxID=321339 RepID=A0A1H3KJ65_9RHOB|nr:DUF533 domain-containing protein [Citreimonas salinaria]SDY52040.1 Protein of unknown function [Citreimonas salinaria]
MGTLRGTANQILGGGAGAASQSSATTDHDQDLREGEAAAEKFSEDEALLMIRATITAAYSDAAVSHDERGRILPAIDEADANPEERPTMECEIANPKPLETLLAQVDNEETAEEVYIAS